MRLRSLLIARNRLTIRNTANVMKTIITIAIARVQRHNAAYVKSRLCSNSRYVKADRKMIIQKSIQPQTPVVYSFLNDMQRLSAQSNNSRGIQQRFSMLSLLASSLSERAERPAAARRENGNLDGVQKYRRCCTPACPTLLVFGKPHNNIARPQPLT